MIVIIFDGLAVVRYPKLPILIIVFAGPSGPTMTDGVSDGLASQALETQRDTFVQAGLLPPGTDRSARRNR